MLDGLALDKLALWLENGNGGINRLVLTNIEFVNSFERSGTFMRCTATAIGFGAAKQTLLTMSRQEFIAAYPKI